MRRSMSADSEAALIFKIVEGQLACGGVDLAHLLAFLEEDAVHAHAGLHAYDFVIDEVAVENGLLDAVAENRGGAEEAHGVGGGRGREADAHGVKMVKRVAPKADLFGRIAPVALVGDDEVKGMDGDVELIGIFLVIGVIGRPGKTGLGPEEVAGHALDGRDVDEGFCRIGPCEVIDREDAGIKGIVPRRNLRGGSAG